jgi:hypothetical protein
VLAGPHDIEPKNSGILYSAWIGASGVDAEQDVKTLEPLLSHLLEIPLKSEGNIISLQSSRSLMSHLVQVTNSSSQTMHIFLQVRSLPQNPTSKAP